MAISSRAFDREGTDDTPLAATHVYQPARPAALEAIEPVRSGYPETGDHEGLRRHIAESDATLAEIMRWAPVDERIR